MTSFARSSSSIAVSASSPRKASTPRPTGTRSPTPRMRSRRPLATIAAALVLVGSLVAGTHARPIEASAKQKAQEFTGSTSRHLLMHQPLLDRAHANAGGSGYDFAPFFKKIAPYVAKVDLGLCHVETPMGPGPITTYPIFNTPTDLAGSIHRSGWDTCDSASNHSLDGGQPGI